MAKSGCILKMESWDFSEHQVWSVRECKLRVLGLSSWMGGAVLSPSSPPLLSSGSIICLYSR